MFGFMEKCRLQMYFIIILFVLIHPLPCIILVRKHLMCVRRNLMNCKICQKFFFIFNLKLIILNNFFKVHGFRHIYSIYFKTLHIKIQI